MTEATQQQQKQQQQGWGGAQFLIPVTRRHCYPVLQRLEVGVGGRGCLSLKELEGESWGKQEGGVWWIFPS